MKREDEGGYRIFRIFVCMFGGMMFTTGMVFVLNAFLPVFEFLSSLNPLWGMPIFFIGCGLGIWAIMGVGKKTKDVNPVIKDGNGGTP